jgi:hypothetical protein
MVCLRNISVDTLHKVYTEDDDDDDDDADADAADDDDDNNNVISLITPFDYSVSKFVDLYMPAITTKYLATSSSNRNVCLQ